MLMMLEGSATTFASRTCAVDGKPVVLTVGTPEFVRSS
jgi:hypothetical protein